MIRRGGRGPFHSSRTSGRPGDGASVGASFLLREDGTSKFLLENDTDKLILEA